MTSCLRKKCQGVYAVEFPLVFIVFLFVVFIALEISRFYLTKTALDASLRSLVNEAKTTNNNALSSLIPKHFKGNYFYDFDKVEISVRSCIGIENYLSDICSSGLGKPQDIVHYKLIYDFNHYLPVISGKILPDWEHVSVLIVRNEPQFDGGNW
ncbi:hypothetical protein VINI7043_06570 [Vibrio nigripulchritudo ATCC 27043]|uniref:TadE/TadG family type IV pilus assembly protein n=1 Tax=Vibrio nigripulchritudo TaxID=28173 RepID=UPI00021C3467|nr:TadE/TadG family type IV pilus assembly protein [Vibrio nigripulchritudo]EGU60269.1 hypothetical protein VINI7043_06570 [Vibrio nigripulchritudo ATCC 27043]BDU36851.1 hypothetical protein TUMSATVNIG2_13200 [Vibrio nigripulchritudo]BDU42561.1 hypothetical protein TUMSATVNIG3_13590 [Vibrio nigripulchritudo]